MRALERWYAKRFEFHGLPVGLLALPVAGCMEGAAGPDAAPGSAAMSKPVDDAVDPASDDADILPSSPDAMPDGSVTPADSSRLSLDWPGTYSGIEPCGDCPDAEVTVRNRAGLDEPRMVDFHK